MILTADLHLHSPFSMAASKNTTPEMIIDACRIKGLDVIGTADILQPVWRAEWEKYFEAHSDNNGVTVIPQTEIETKGKIHHVILMNDFSQAEEIADRLRPYSPNIDTGGRPNVNLPGEKVLEIVHDCGAYAGPAHAFTPWTGMYGRVDSIRDCYGEEKPDFLELGLSADTSYGVGNPEISSLPFLSNSDAHSTQFHKLGREFNVLECRDASVSGVLKAVIKGNIVMNAGLFPEEGKYNRTACTRCYKQYSETEAAELNYKCSCGGKIKTGVYNRALSKQTADNDEIKRPPYLHIIPLPEIIKAAFGISSASSKQCMKLYFSLIDSLGTEIEILTNVSVEKIAEKDRRIAEAVNNFRTGNITLHAGGGGQYGTFEFLSP